MVSLVVWEAEKVGWLTNLSFLAPRFAWGNWWANFSQGWVPGRVFSGFFPGFKLFRAGFRVMKFFVRIHPWFLLHSRGSWELLSQLLASLAEVGVQSSPSEPLDSMDEMLVPFLNFGSLEVNTSLLLTLLLCSRKLVDKLVFGHRVKSKMKRKAQITPLASVTIMRRLQLSQW